MQSDPKTMQTAIDHFKDVLRRSGVKLTHQRIEIFRQVSQTVEHPDAETIYEGVRKRIPTISLDTVYRTLSLFTDLGLVTTLAPPQERIRYDANMRPHHHFICNQCDMAYDFYSQTFDGLQTPQDVAEWGTVETIHVELRGLCLRCSNMRKEKIS